MGLDMYLTREIYIGAKYEHRAITGTIELFQGEGEKKKPIPIDFKKVSTITVEVAYWRKSNHIHNWFVNYVQDGKDECQTSYVDRQDLQTLIDLCKEVLEDHSKAAELLPTESGFFFGNTNYDEWYFEDLEETVKMLTEALADKTGEFYYRASW